MNIKTFFVCLVTFFVTDVISAQEYGDYPINGVPFSDVQLNDNFWYPRIVQNQTTTIPIALNQCYSTGRVDNFKKAAAILKGENIGYFSTEYTFDDTDIYKILEGMSYSYQTLPNDNLKSTMNELIEIVAAAQEPDGYLFTARTAAKPGAMHSWVGAERWSYDPNLSHELYNSGHLFEAATAHFTATGDSSLLKVAIKNADLLVDNYLYGSVAYECGHQIVEMGLVKMYRITGKEDYLKLAKKMLDIRGINGPNSKHYEYNQSHMPPKNQREAVGHAVRATYMYSGMADVAAIMGADEYQTAIDAIWENVVDKKYYITGGIGAKRNGEAFDANYVLPNLTAYNETCAAIANVYWNWRMFLTHGDSKYYDVIERTLYNGALSGISLSGDHFFYPNPLESDGGYSRSEWFGCACCPSNLCRFIPSIPGYIYAHQDNSIYVNLFVQGTANVNLDTDNQIVISQTTDYPWNGNVKISIDKAPSNGNLFALRVRIPGWAKDEPVPSDLYTYIDENKDRSFDLKLNGESVKYNLEQGYMVVERNWNDGDYLSIEFPMDVRRVIANDNVRADKGKVSLERGPIVYCLEWPDNDGEVLTSVVNDSAKITAYADTELLNGQKFNDIIALNIEGCESTYSEGTQIIESPKNLKAIPYYAWANRGAGEMEVWIARSPAYAKVSTKVISKTDTIKMTVAQTKSTASVNGGYPSVPAIVNRAAVAKTFGLTTSELTSLYGSLITYAALENDDRINTSSTAGDPGHWFNNEGDVCNWADSNSTLFSEFQKGTYVFNVGQYPNKCSEGDTYRIRQALTYYSMSGAPSRVVFEITLNVTDAKGVYNQVLANAKQIIESNDYNNVIGTVRTSLQNTIDANPNNNYTSAANIINTALLAFIDAKANFDDFTTNKAIALDANNLYPYALDSKIATLKAVADKTPSSATEAATYASEIEKQIKTVVLSNADAEKKGGINYIHNPEFSNGQPTGWEVTSFMAGFKNYVNDANYDDVNRPYYLNFGSWGQGVYSFDLALSQTISQLPKGKYVLSMMARGKDLDQFTGTLYNTATGYSQTYNIAFFGNTGQMFTDGWTCQWFEFDNPAEGDVKLTIIASGSHDQVFCSIGRFRLIKVADTLTDINTLNEDKANIDNSILNLSGIRMTNQRNKLPKGIYIQKGKKIIIK